MMKRYKCAQKRKRVINSTCTCHILLEDCKNYRPSIFKWGRAGVSLSYYAISDFDHCVRQ
uniref:Uncharacterized protein n=1 Tax=Aegilops tauschii subsp. strangulata TaxID=200361 RepID=A0A453HLX1_AEGTS